MRPRVSALHSSELRRRRDEIVRRHGPWTGYNLHLGDDVWTIGAGVEGVAEARLRRIVQLVTDVSRRRLSDLRILDLGAHEGGFAVELASQGATVVAVEARHDSAAKARFAQDVMRLERLRVIEDDVRNLDPLELGAFDVVLCLGLLYHLDGPEVFELLSRIADHCQGTAVIETQVSLSARTTVEHRGRIYAGCRYRENLSKPGASVINRESFWPTRASLLNALDAVGFPTVFECLNPVIPALAAARDHVTLVALAGERAQLVATDDGLDGSEPWPEQLGRFAHPQQGFRYAIEERFRRGQGGGLPAIFEKRAEARDESGRSTPRDRPA